MRLSRPKWWVNKQSDITTYYIEWLLISALRSFIKRLQIYRSIWWRSFIYETDSCALFSNVQLWYLKEVTHSTNFITHTHTHTHPVRGQSESEGSKCLRVWEDSGVRRQSFCCHLLNVCLIPALNINIDFWTCSVWVTHTHTHTHTHTNTRGTWMLLSGKNLPYPKCQPLWKINTALFFLDARTFLTLPPQHLWGWTSLTGWRFNPSNGVKLEVEEVWKGDSEMTVWKQMRRREEKPETTWEGRTHKCWCKLLHLIYFYLVLAGFITAHLFPLTSDFCWTCKGTSTEVIWTFLQAYNPVSHHFPPLLSIIPNPCQTL